jgi:hypothetical protein
VWRGSSDSRLAGHVEKFASEPDVYLPTDKWQGLLAEIFDKHTVNGVKLKTGSVDSLLKPVLYYYYVLNQQKGPDGIDVTIEIDHIIPQEMFDSSTLLNKELKIHNLSNLALLPKKDNISKRNQPLRDITDPWLKTQVSSFTSSPEGDFERFSKVQSIDDLKDFRKGFFMEAFGGKRDNLFIG